MLSIQVHGGYGYTSEYLPEAWMRDQKLNSIHEGTTGIQSLDLLGRKAMAEQGGAITLLDEEITAALREAEAAGVPADWVRAVGDARKQVIALTAELGQRGAEGDVEGMLRHSADYLDLFATLVVGWIWLRQAACAQRGLREAKAEDEAFYRGKLKAAQYWIRTELPRIALLAELCRSAEDSYATWRPDEV